MAKTGFKSVDECIATHPEAAPAILQRVRRTLRQARPDAKEVIRYKMPTYELPDSPVLHFAGWKPHDSLHPATDWTSHNACAAPFR